jgi:hypothetical protein
MNQTPRGPENLDCPFWRKSMSKVCHRCPLWQQLRGRNPNTGEQIDEWSCTFKWLLPVLIDVANVGRSGAAATESFRNEMCIRSDRENFLQLKMHNLPLLNNNGSDNDCNK